MTSRTLKTLLFLAATPVGPVSGQNTLRQLPPGTRIRVEVAGSEGWQSGRLASYEANRLVMERDGVRSAFDLTEVVSLQTETRSGRGAVIGASIGGAAGLLLSTQALDAAGSSDAAGVILAGALVGAAWGSGGQAKVAGGIGLLAGAAIGSIAFGATQSACESGASVGCHYFTGGALVGALGLIVGTGIGVLLPNWRSLPLDGVQLGVSSDGGPHPRFTVMWSVDR